MTRVSVVGTGVIGTGWAARCLAAGLDVVAWDPAPDFGPRLARDIRRLWPMIKQRGLHESASPDRLTLAPDLATACRNASHVQESIPEDLSLKRSLHAEIDQLAAPDTLVASSSSGLLPTDIQSAMARPERFVVGHPFNPVYLLPLVEIVAGHSTAPDVVDRAREFYLAIGMHPLVVRNEVPGYLSDRLQEAMWREILHLVNDGVADTGELDDAIVYGPGLRWALMGTCLTFHLAGGPGGMRHMLEQFGPALKQPWTHLAAPALTPALIERMVEGTQRQADGRGVEELEQLRDDCLIELLEVVEKYRARLHDHVDNRSSR